MNQPKPAAHTLQEQLEQLKVVHAAKLAKLAKLKGPQHHDMKEVDQLLEADMAWSGQHARLTTMRIEGAD